MLHFKSRHDLSQLPSSDPAFSVIKSIVDELISPTQMKMAFTTTRAMDFGEPFCMFSLGWGWRLRDCAFIIDNPWIQTPIAEG